MNQPMWGFDSSICHYRSCRTIKATVSIWLDSYHEDFHDPPHYKDIHLIIDFAKHLGDSDLEVRTRHRLEKFFKEDGLSGN